MNDKALIDQAVKAAFKPQFAPQQQAPPQVQQGIPIQAVVALVSCGVLTPRQGWYWLFQNVEPTEFDEVKENV